MDGDVVRGLRSRGIDVVTAAEAGMIRRQELRLFGGPVDVVDDEQSARGLSRFESRARRSGNL
jgi:hypothetical protein